MGTQPQEMTEEQKRVMSMIIDNTENIKCQCGNDIFSKGINMKRLPRLITGKEHDDFMQFAVMYCVKCHNQIPLDDLPVPENLIKVDFRKE